MKRILLICSVLVVVQLVVTALVYQRDRESGRTLDTGPLVTLDSAAVHGLELEGGDGRTLVLNKVHGAWRIPALADFPADTLRVQRLIERIGAVQRGWPEATTAEAAVRFRVTGDHFARKLTLRGEDGSRDVFYFGSSPGLRRMYFRVEGDREIHSLQMMAHELEVLADAWIDSGALHLKAEQVERVELPGITLVRREEGLQPVDLDQGEELLKDRRDALVRQLTNLSITAVLGTASRPEYGLDNPFYQYSLVLADGRVIDYVFGRPLTAEGSEEDEVLADDSPVARVSGYAHLFRVEAWQVDDIVRVNRDTLVHRPGDDGPSAGMELQEVPEQ